MGIREQAASILGRAPGKYIVECGGHIGHDTEFFLAAIPGCHYYVVEPDPRNIELFRSKGLHYRTQLIEAAVADKDGTALLHQSSGTPDAETTADTSRDWSYSSSIVRPRRHLIAHPWCRFPTEVSVKTRSLDSLATEYKIPRVDLLWVDVQGVERQLLLGGQQTLTRTKLLAIEYSNEEMYEGQAPLEELERLLPGRWSTVVHHPPYVLFHNETAILQQTSRILIGALSGLAYQDRRNLCRETWMREVRMQESMDAVFLLGCREMVTEPMRIDDMLLLPCPDEYPALPQRTRAFCRWALTSHAWDYLFKCDDDTYVNVERLRELRLEGDYIGSEWKAGTDYGSGGAGYFLSRKAARVVAEKLVQEVGAEDELVGRVLKEHGIPLSRNDTFVAFGDWQRRPRRDNDLVTTHGIGEEIFKQSARETGGDWKFRIVMPTCNAYAKPLTGITSALLKRFWPDHPPVDVLCFEEVPPPYPRILPLRLGEQRSLTWCQAMAKYLQEFNADELVLLMLDDYGLCSAVKRETIRRAERRLLADPRIANIHFSWQPTQPKIPRDDLVQLPRWAYSVNTQAALWRRSVLLEVLLAHLDCNIENFELNGSRWFNERRFGQFAHCQIAMPEPANPSGFVDETDKTHWAIPYNNLMRRGRFDERHADFLAQHGLRLEMPSG